MLIYHVESLKVLYALLVQLHSQLHSNIVVAAECHLKVTLLPATTGLSSFLIIIHQIWYSKEREEKNIMTDGTTAVVGAEEIVVIV